MYALGQKAWLLLVGPVNLLIITVFTSPSAQGFYYTFSSIMALQSFAELGFYIVIINFASHEWSALRIDESGAIQGDRHALSRLVSLGRFVFRWYSVTAIMFTIGAGLLGWLLMGRQTSVEIPWQIPWVILALLTGLNFWALPFTYILEGCNQLASLNQFRLRQAIVMNISFWAILPFFGPLWGLVGIALVSLLTLMHFLLIHHRNFFRPFWRHAETENIHWFMEIWPMQWRLGAQGMVNYFLTSVFTPIIFYYHGSVDAGRMGMTCQVLSGLQSISNVWNQTKTPAYGMLVAKKKFGELDSLWKKNSGISILVLLLGGGAFLLALETLASLQLSLAARLLTPSITFVMLGATLLGQIVQCEASYLRAHKKEPLLLIGIGTGLLSGLLAWQLGKIYGSMGIGLASLAATSLFSFPGATIIWWRCRKQWHQQEGGRMKDEG